MSRLNQKNTVSGTYQIVDSPKVAMFFVLSLLGIGGGICSAYRNINTNAAYGGSFIFILVGVVIFYVFQVNRKGYLVSVEDDILEFPGSGLVADSFFSYFLPSFWMQHFKRYQISVSEIRQLDKYNKTKRSASNGKTTSSTTYYLDLDGEFGAISFSFMSKHKRDELYSLIMRVIQQGPEILDRDYPEEEYSE